MREQKWPCDEKAQGKYRCKKCDELWEFCPEDYDNPDQWPSICPFCKGKLRWAVKEIYHIEGIWAVVKYTFKRYL